MDLKDYNGDGTALEFAFFDAESCSGLRTQLVGYSPRKDRVIQYPIDLKGIWYDGRDPTVLWLDGFLLTRPSREGIWEYTRRYPGTAAVSFKIKYDAVLERFSGTVQWANDR